MNLRVKLFLGTLTTFLVMWLLHPFYVRNIEAVMEERGWDQLLNRALSAAPEGGAGMHEYGIALWQSSPFWLGALSVLVLWGALEAIFAFRRAAKTSASTGLPLLRQRRASQPSQEIEFKEESANRDLIAQDPPLRVVGTSTPDYIDVSVTLRFKNRSQHSLWLERMDSHLSIEGKGPAVLGGSLTRPFNSGAVSNSLMGTVRIYEEKIRGLSGIVAFSILYGINKKTARTVVHFCYEFSIKAEPDPGNPKKAIEYEIVADLTNYELVKSEDQKHQSPASTA